jgi:antitoxin component of MazEF toxin-antitoxin module
MLLQTVGARAIRNMDADMGEWVGGSQACTIPPGLLEKVRIEDKENIFVKTRK